MDFDFRDILLYYIWEFICFCCLVMMKLSCFLVDCYRRKIKIYLLWLKELDIMSLESKFCVEFVIVCVFKSCVGVCFLIFFGSFV